VRNVYNFTSKAVAERLCSILNEHDPSLRAEVRPCDDYYEVVAEADAGYSIAWARGIGYAVAVFLEPDSM
jgi:hypothetical protein